MRVQTETEGKKFPPLEIKKFMDIRNHGFFRVAAIVPQVSLANPDMNSSWHASRLVQAAAKGAQYAVCPELGLTGYSVQDLFFDQTLQHSSLKALAGLLELSLAYEMVVSVGMPLEFNNAIYNCAVTYYKGRILAITPKLYPPEYREFYELRHFARGSEAHFDTVTVLGQTGIPFGTDILIRSRDIPGFVLHTQVCEDGWVPVPPSSLAVLAGATVVANLSASNVTIDKDTAREKMFAVDSMRWNCAYIYTAAGFGESTTDLSWDGHAFIAERGEVLTRTKPFEMFGSHIMSDINLRLLSTERQRQSSFHQNGSNFKKQLSNFRIVEFDGSLGLDDHHPAYKNFLRTIDPRPFIPEDLALRDKRCWQAFNMQATSLARRLKTLPQDKQKIVIGVSGGQDSTLALLVATRAMDLLRLPRTNIIGLTMPGYGTTKRTQKNATDLMKALGVTWHDISIKPIADKIFKAIKHNMEIEDPTFENVQAWSRKYLELSMAAENGAMDLGTGDLSEGALGWCTMFADHSSHFNPNAGVPKTLVTYLILWAADKIFENEPKVQKTLRDIVDTPISPELKRPGKDGQIEHKTEDIVGPYELVDFYMYYFVRFGYSPTLIARLALQAFEGRPGRDLVTIKKFLKVFITRFFANQYKRNCVPDGVKLGLTSLSPRGDWRMPSDAEVFIWLKDVDSIPV